MRDRTAALLLGITSVTLRLFQLQDAADAVALGYLVLLTVGVEQLPGVLNKERARLDPALAPTR